MESGQAYPHPEPHLCHPADILERMARLDPSGRPRRPAALPLATGHRRRSHGRSGNRAARRTGHCHGRLPRCPGTWKTYTGMYAVDAPPASGRPLTACRARRVAKPSTCMNSKFPNRLAWLPLWVGVRVYFILKRFFITKLDQDTTFY